MKTIARIVVSSVIAVNGMNLTSEPRATAQ
jgi:hypothetical protein